METLLQALVEFVDSFEFVPAERLYRRIFNTTDGAMVGEGRMAYGSASICFKSLLEQDADDETENENVPKPFGGGWMTLPRIGENGEVGIFTYNRNTTEDFDYSCERIIHSVAPGPNPAYIIVHDCIYNYMRVWADGRYEPIAAMTALCQ